MSTEDDESSERSKEPVTDDSIIKIHKVILVDCKMNSHSKDIKEMCWTHAYIFGFAKAFDYILGVILYSCGFLLV